MKTYLIQTIGCQMIERGSETIAGMLEQMGYTADSAQERAVKQTGNIKKGVRVFTVKTRTPIDLTMPSCRHNIALLRKPA